jgi:hypothetical protein
MNDETARILEIPEDPRTPKTVDPSLVERMTAKYSTDDGTRDLWEVQALALDVIEKGAGLVGAIGVGHGKTLIGLLASRALTRSEHFDVEVGPYETLYLTPAALRESVQNQIDEHKPHFQIDPYVHVKSYGELSHHKRGPKMLDKIAPKLVILDEAHKVSNADSARTGRLLSYLDDHPSVCLVAMSGTLTNKSIEDYRHFLYHALGGQNTPLPNSYHHFESWSRVLDPQSGRPDHAKSYDWERLEPLELVYGEGRGLTDVYPLDERRERAREAYLERFKTTPGVVKTTTSAAQCSLRIRSLDTPDVPEHVESELTDLEETWAIWDNGEIDEEVDDPLSFYRKRRNLLAGFYYRRDWSIEPFNGTVDKGLVRARREWNQIERELVSHGPDDVDSPYFAREAVKEGRLDHRRDVMEAWNAWKDHRDKPWPPSEGIRVSDYLLDHAIERARSSDRSTIIWYAQKEIARWLEEKGVEVYWAGERNPEDAPDDADVIACSTEAHRKGKNLQSFSHNIVLTPMGSGTAWEQLIGRTHRPGQSADEVLVDIYAHCEPYRDALGRAIEEAQFKRQTEGSRQKLLYADWTPPLKKLT